MRTTSGHSRRMGYLQGEHKETHININFNTNARFNSITQLLRRTNMTIRMDVHSLLLLLARVSTKVHRCSGLCKALAIIPVSAAAWPSLSRISLSFPLLKLFVRCLHSKKKTKTCDGTSSIANTCSSEIEVLKWL